MSRRYTKAKLFQIRKDNYNTAPMIFLGGGSNVSQSEPLKFVWNGDYYEL